MLLTCFCSSHSQRDAWPMVPSTDWQGARQGEQNQSYDVNTWFKYTLFYITKFWAIVYFHRLLRLLLVPSWVFCVLMASSCVSASGEIEREVIPPSSGGDYRPRRFLQPRLLLPSGTGFFLPGVVYASLMTCAHRYGKNNYQLLKMYIFRSC